MSVKPTRKLKIIMSSIGQEICQMGRTMVPLVRVLFMLCN
jgi:hypothetical protein